jgi:hypothetical protein
VDWDANFEIFDLNFPSKESHKRRGRGETRIRRGGTAMTKTRERQLYQALKAHKVELEITRRVASGRDREALNRRVEAVWQLLEWLSQAPEPEPPVFPEVQTPPPSSFPADQRQISPSALDTPDLYC